MFRIIATSCRIGSRYNTLNKVRDNIMATSRMSSGNANVIEASEKAKEEARKALYEVTSVIGKSEHGLAHEPEYDDAYIQRFVDFFNRKNIDHWEIRRAIHDLVDYDTIPDPKIVCACLRACRRLNDYALAIRFLEVTKDKCGNKEKEYYPYILQEIRPTLKELGLETIEELGYDKPELAVVDIDDIH